MTKEDALFFLTRFRTTGINENLYEALGVAIEALSIQSEYRWIPCSERLPKENGFYLTSTTYGEVYLDDWNGINWERSEEILAWMPLPEPYKEGEQE